MAILPYPLGPFGSKRTSQNDEDGVIYEIADCIRPPQFFVEIGVEPQEGNCWELHRQGWLGLFMDAKGGDRRIKREFVTPVNVNDLLDLYQVRDIGVLSIDIDGQDIWLWHAIKRGAALVVIEYNGRLPMDRSIAIQRKDDFVWDGSPRYGASLKALDTLAHHKGYVLVYANGVNGFFVRRDYVSNPEAFRYEEIYRPGPGDPISDLSGFVHIG